ncbi:Mov34/MPN/PAD-1 family protein [Candidatus Omnitrophota bacterium]
MLYLTKEQLEELVNHSKEGFPDEVCGILAGRDGRVKKIYKMQNTDKSKMSFFMDPGEQLRVMKEIKTLSMEFIGIYHSHPETEARPSAHDVELASYPEVSYVIISLKDKDNPETRSFRIVEGKIEEETISFKELGVGKRRYEDEES